MNYKNYRVALAALVLGFSGTALAAGGDDTITVMTRNIYVGADIFRVIEANPNPPINILLAIQGVYATVLQTDFAERAEALADEVFEHQPHLIGLQEVALLRRQSPGDALDGNPIVATEIDMDYLQLLLDALGARGLNYNVVATVDNADVELPLITQLSLDDIRLTDRDVILARADVNIANADGGNYADNVSFDLVGSTIEFTRGYTAVDATVGSRNYRFVNTHLETGGAFGADIQALQAAELVQLFAGETRPLIIVGDFNSSPSAAATQPYPQMIAAGYSDAWLLGDMPQLPGLTCCHNETLSNPVADFGSRIDLIFGRASGNPPFDTLAIEVLGEELADQTASGLWPSDHAGVVATLRVREAGPGDADGDGVDDSADNCPALANAAQRDTDGDGFGNRCDADLNQDGIVDFLDLGLFKQRFLSADPGADFDGDGTVDFVDLGILRALFFQPPG